MKSDSLTYLIYYLNNLVTPIEKQSYKRIVYILAFRGSLYEGHSIKFEQSLHNTYNIISKENYYDNNRLSIQIQINFAYKEI